MVAQFWPERPTNAVVPPGDPVSAIATGETGDLEPQRLAFQPWRESNHRDDRVRPFRNGQCFR